MKYAIVTGVSKGLGMSVATFLLESGINVYGLSRTKTELTEVAKENNVHYAHFSCDLGKLTNTKEVITSIKEDLNTKKISQLYVINNAAVVKPIKKSTDTTGDELSYHYQLNVISPMMLVNECLHVSNEKRIPFIGVNITSGAANRPVYGWSAYCSSKASLNMYTKAVALEQEELKTHNKIIAFNPGVMNTDMQAEIRASDYHEFIDVDTFKHYKKQNLLSDTEAVAGVLVDILTDEVNVKNGKIYDVKDYF
ncbi:(S)-benzoin forming benzil reductase [Pseudogracilibacillus auburnensis]|uniref:(S)-benzoin forming benzil reductase n=1 Tax=Pseudogracilibacillus auburnensis TaxID=1494959 RepID=UPI001A967DD6|nr:(S)-benzoin forming benzil reductase [Pseudogracilibacillus auburnensis]MBO1002899.1 (S)-benzoin forming benzil reductase [Pseudogracilibacillus auburnensis]